MKISFDEVIEFAESESGCCWYQVEYDRYVILYNDTIDNTGHIRWTVAHEMGHFILKHNEESDKTLISRNSLTKAEYDVLEKEANCFARSLLAPPNILVALGVKTVDSIINACSISHLAASNVVQFLNIGVSMGVRYSATSNIMKSFKAYIFGYMNSKYCSICGFAFDSETTNYCPICGYQRLFKTGGRKMKYTGHELDEKGHALICPKCENEETTLGGSCIICGTGLVNKCARTNTYNNGYESYDESCDTLAPGNARYCYSCGNETTFFQSEVLESWEIAKSKLEAAASLDDTPF